ncbi:MAG: DbpA RNA binding domain-containing protein, partial [Planctomycetota bacterium]
LEALGEEHQHSMKTIASALAYLVQQERPLQPPEPTIETHGFRSRDDWKSDPRAPREGGASRSGQAQPPMTSYRLAVGRKQGVKPKHIVGAIANETGIDGRAIGRIEVHDDHCVVDLREDTPKPILKRLYTIEIFGHPLRVKSVDKASGVDPGRYKSHGKNGGNKKHPWDAKVKKHRKGAKDAKGKGGKSSKAHGKPKARKAKLDK